MRHRSALALLLSGLVLATGCSVKKVAVNVLGNALAEGGSIYASDDDPELVKGAIPFGLKTIESLLAASPEHRGLLLSACSGFTQYGYAFVQQEADFVEANDLAQATAQRARAKRLYLRAYDYGLRGLEAAHAGSRDGLRGGDRAAALSAMRRGDVPTMYWTTLSLAAAISIAKEDSELAADLGLTEAIMKRALELDESFGGGAIHDFFISYDGGRPPSAGGSVVSARRHFERAVALSNGTRAAPYVSLAESVAVSSQNRKEFEQLLAKALAIDADLIVDQRLANLISQKRARWLLTRLDDLFVE